MRFNRKEEPAEDSFNFTAMMDVMFILLIFFITTSIFSELESEVGIQLPSAEASETKQRTRTKIIINIDANGEISVNNRVFTLQKLEETLSLLSEEGATSVAIRADAETPHGRTIDVLDAAAKADITDIGFVTLKERSAEEAS